MPMQLRAEIHRFLHDYRKSVFALEHDPEAIQTRQQRVESFVHELLDQKFHYHLHQKVDRTRADMIQLIHHYCQEALLPPIVNRLAERVVFMEQRHAKALELVEKVLDKLSEGIEDHSA